MGEDTNAPGEVVLFKEHFEEEKMGEYVREVRFAEHVVLHSVQVLAKKELPWTGSDFEGRTFPNVQTMSLSVFATDRESPRSTFAKLKPGATLGVFVTGRDPQEPLLTDCLIIRGEYLRLSFVVYGAVCKPDEPLELENSAPEAYLRPISPFAEKKLDLDVCQGGEGVEAEVGGAPFVEDPNSSRIAHHALASPSVRSGKELLTCLQENAAWIGQLSPGPGLLDADGAVTKRLQECAKTLGALVVQVFKMSRMDGALLISGQKLVAGLLEVIERSRAQLEFRLLCGALQALRPLLAVPALTAEFCVAGGLSPLLGCLRGEDWQPARLRLLALQALAEMCSHSFGIEALLGWGPGGAVPDGQPCGYEAVLELAVQGAPGMPSMENLATSMLRKASFYAALAKLDNGCQSLDASQKEAIGSKLQELGETLTEVTALFDTLTTKRKSARAWDAIFLEEDIPDPSVEFGETPATAVDDMVSDRHPSLDSDLQSFLASRRLVPNLCILLWHLPALMPAEQLGLFEAARTLLCSLLSCTGGIQFLALPDPKAFGTLLRVLGGSEGLQASESLIAVPRFPEQLARRELGPRELASLLNLQARAMRLVIALFGRARAARRGGLLAEADSLSLVRELHRLCSSGAPGRNAVVSAFRSKLLVDLLMFQLEHQLKEASTMRAAQGIRPPQPSMHHLVAILHALVIHDRDAGVAAAFGERILALATRGQELLEDSIVEGESSGGSSRGGALEFAFDSAGPEGGLSRAVRAGRRTADVYMSTQLRELIEQLKPWQTKDEVGNMKQGEIPVARLLECVRQPEDEPRSFKKVTTEERVGHFPLLLGGFCGARSGVEVAEVDYAKPDNDPSNTEVCDDERQPASSLLVMPLLPMRLLCRRSAASARDCLAILLGDQGAGASTSESGLTVLVPVLIRCAAALNLNIEASALQDDKEAIDDIHASQRAHAELLEASLETIFNILRGVKALGLRQFRHTGLLQALLLLNTRLLSNSVVAVTGGRRDPELQMLWRQCLVWVCRVYHMWVQSCHATGGGQLLQPLLRHMRVLPWHFAPGLLLLATCGSLNHLLPTVPHSFSIETGGRVTLSENSLVSQELLVPVDLQSGAPTRVVLSVVPSERESPFSAEVLDRAKLFGQFWGPEGDADDIDENAAQQFKSSDPLVCSLLQTKDATSVASVLSLVERVNARWERLSVDDLAEIITVVVQCTLTSSSLLHHTVVRCLHQFARLGIPILDPVLRIGEAALQGAAEQDPGIAASPARVNSEKSLLRLLLLLGHYGRLGVDARRQLLEHRAETFCLSVLSQSLGLERQNITVQAIRVLGLMCCPGEGEGEEGFVTSVPTMRMVSKSLSKVLNESLEEVLTPEIFVAALELLLRLNEKRGLCLSLLFSTTDDMVEEDAKEVPVEVDCAFKLDVCSQRLARELEKADVKWDATLKGSKSEKDAEMELSSWLQVGELLVRMLQTVLVYCPTASVFFAVMHPTVPASIEPEMVEDILDDVFTSLASIKGRLGRSESIPVSAASLIGDLRSLRQSLSDTDTSSPPQSLLREDLNPPPSARAGEPTSSTASGSSATPDNDEEDVFGTVMSIFDGAADLEEDDDWRQSSGFEGANMSMGLDTDACEFNASAERRKRQAVREKAEAERRAKRPKLGAGVTEVEQDGRRYRKRAGEDFLMHFATRWAPSAPVVPVVESTSTALAIPKESPSTSPNGVGSSDPGAVKVVQQAEVAKSATAVPAVPTPSPAASPTTEAQNNDAAIQAASLQKFLSEHPEYMRVLKDPIKTLGDPRVKMMFMKDLQNYPAVKTFFASKGLNLT